MAELTPGRGIPEPLTREMHVSSRKVLYDLIGHHPDSEAISALTLAINTNFPLLPQRSQMTWQERRTERRPIASGDIPVFRDTVKALIQRGKLDSETVKIEDFDDHLNQREADLRLDERARLRTRLIAVAATVVFGTAGVTALVSDKVKRDAIAQEQSLLLTDAAGAYSYEANWQIAAAIPQKGYKFIEDPHGVAEPIGEDQGIIVYVNGNPVNTQVEVHGYPTVAGETGIELLVPTDTPYHQVPGLGINIRSWRLAGQDVIGQRSLVLAPQAIVVFVEPNRVGHVMKIVDNTPNDATDPVFSAVPLLEVPQ